MKSGGSDWYQLGGKRVAEDRVVDVPLGEEVERRARLLVGHPEHRGGDEEHGDHHQPLALLGGPLAAQEQPGEERHRDAQQHPLEVAGDRIHVERHAPRSPRARWRRPARPPSPDPPGAPAGPPVPPPPDRSAGPAGAAPATDAFRRSVYWIRPQSMPTAAAPKPQCQDVCAPMPADSRIARKPSLCASHPVMSGAMKRARVDAHVVDRVPRVPPHVVGRVERARPARSRWA